MTQAPALVVFDLDGTLLRGPTVCEVLAEHLGHLPRMQEIERVRGKDEIRAAREEMVLWYRDVPRRELLESLAGVRLAPGLADGVALLQAYGATIAIASITWHFAAKHLADAFGIEHCLATGLDDAGAIAHVWPGHKAQWLRELAARFGVPLERTAAVGDSAGDYDMLDAAGEAIFVGADAPPDTRWRHMPAADIAHVAAHLIGAWSLRDGS